MRRELIVRRRSVSLRLGPVRAYVHALKPRLDSDRIPMREVEWDIWLGNLMVLGNLTFSKVKR